METIALAVHEKAMTSKERICLQMKLNNRHFDKHEHSHMTKFKHLQHRMLH